MNQSANWHQAGCSQGRSLVWHYPNHWEPTGPGINFCSAIRNDDWKLVYYHDASRKDGQYALFNLSDDIGESNNLAPAYPERVAKLADNLAVNRLPTVVGPDAAQGNAAHLLFVGQDS